MADVKLTISGKNLTKQAIDQLKRDLEQTTQRLSAMGQGTAKVEQETRKARTGVMELAVGLGAVSAATMLVVKSGVGAAIQFERMKLGLAAVAGSAQAATAQMIEFRKLAKMPGLGLPEVVKAATSLQALDMTLSTTTQVIREWGNELVRMGKGRMELDRIVLALTQMIGKGKGFGQEIRQIAEAMPSIRKHMQSAFGTTASEEFVKMGITAQKFIAGITAELAKMPRVAGGAANATENFTDAIFNAKVAMGEAFLPALTKALEIGSRMLEKYSEMPEAFRAMTSWSLLAVGGITALGAAVASAVFIFDKAVIGLAALKSALETTYILLLYNPWVVYAAGAAAAVTALVLLYKHLQKAKYDIESLTKSVDDLTASTAQTQEMRRLADRLEELRKKVGLTEDELKELKDIQEKLIAISPAVIEKFNKEGNAAEVSAEKVRAYADEVDRLNKVSKDVKIREAEDQIKHYAAQVEKAKASQKMWADRLEVTNKRIQESGRIHFIYAGGMSHRIDLQKIAIDQEKERQKAADDATEAEKKRVETQRNLDILIGKRQRVALGPPVPAPAPAPYELTKEEKEAFLELQKARAEAIEDEYDKRVALAEAAFRAETEGLEDERKAIKDSEAREEEKYMKLSALDAKLQAAQLRRETAIREAQKKRAEESEKAAQDTHDAEVKRLDELAKRNKESWDIRIEQNKRLMEITQRNEEESEREDKERLDRMRDQNQKNTDYKIAANKRLMEITKRGEEEAARERKEQLDWLMARLKEDQEFQKRQQADMLAIVQAAQDSIRQEAARTFDAYYVAEEMRISLINDTTQRELQQAKLVYETKVGFIKAELAEAEISFDRRAELERQLAYLKEQYAKDTAAIQTRTTDDMLMSVSDAIAELPGEFARAWWEARGLAKEYADEFRELQEDSAREADRISSDYTKSAAQKHRELERLEKESAQRRLDIEKRMDEERRGIYSDFVKSFFAQLMGDMERMLIQQELTPRIFGFLKQAIFPAATVATGGGWAGIAAAAAPMLAGLGFDNPANDATARDFGRHAAMLYGASFDNPVNDLNAKLTGTRVAAYSLGRRSADDMVENFTKGFVQQAGTPAAGKQSDDELKGLLKDLKHALANPAPFNLMVDGREVHSIIQRIGDRKTARSEAY